MKEKKRLLKMLELVKEQITAIKEDYPYNLKPIVQSEKLTAEKKTSLEETVLKFQEIIENYKKRIKEMLR